MYVSFGTQSFLDGPAGLLENPKMTGSGGRGTATVEGQR